jgi:PAS domain S-box-containing protein
MDVNRATERVTGASREQLIGSDFSTYFTDPEKARRGYEEVFAKGSVRDYLLVIRATNGRLTDVLYNATVFTNDRGDTEGVFAAARDITERRRAEQALENSLRLLQNIIDSSPDLIFVKDRELRTTLCNKFFAESVGKSSAEIYGKNDIEIGWDPLHVKGDPTRNICGYEQDDRAALAGERVRVTEEALIHGNVVVFDTVKLPLRNEAGEITAILGTSRDVTEQKRAEQEIRKLNDELEERVQQRTAELEASNKELEAFTYSVSHDLRAPLRHISGFSKILLEEFASQMPPEAQHYLTKVADGTRRMGTLVDDLLNLARVGRSELRTQVTGLNSIVEEVRTDLAFECENRQVEWQIGALPFVECDPSLMKQVFQNLMSNALKFTRPRGRAVIEIGQLQTSGANTVFIRDNGVGFSMKYADKLFGVFQRLHRAEDFEGTGVGLATVQRIIR